MEDWLKFLLESIKPLIGAAVALGIAYLSYWRPNKEEHEKNKIPFRLHN